MRLSFIAEEQHNGVRLDRALTAFVTQLSRTRLKKLIEEGQVSLDGSPALQPKTKLRPGQQIQITIPDILEPGLEPEAIPLKILYEDSSIIVIDKPPGLVTHPGAGVTSGTLVNALLHHCSDLSGVGGVRRPGIVHRIDKDTSGIIVVAKNDQAHTSLADQFQKREIDKEYLAICQGVPEDLSGKIDMPIGRDNRVRIKMAVNHSTGKPALTKWRLEKPLKGAALLKVKIYTGRTHQIRVHLSHIGHPILGDTRYQGPSEMPTSDGQIFKVERQLLHSWRISFTHPVTQKRISFQADLPQDFLNTIALLQG